MGIGRRQLEAHFRTPKFSERISPVALKLESYTGLPMPQTSIKAKIVRAVEDLPEDATIEDAIERLVFLHKIEVGLRQARQGKTAPFDEVETRLQVRRQAKQAG